MGDAYSKDEKCAGCEHWSKAWTIAPCNECSVGFSGMQVNHYRIPITLGVPECTDSTVSSAVKSPRHYQLCDMAAIDVIRKTLTPEQLKGYILGNILKYRLRAGKKDDTEQDIRKALEYEEMYDRYFGE